MVDLHPRKLATAALYPRPPWCLGTQATARMSRTYDSCDPPVRPWETSIIGASGSRLWLKGGVKSIPRVPPSGRRMYFLREYEKMRRKWDKDSSNTTFRILRCFAWKSHRLLSTQFASVH